MGTLSVIFWIVIVVVAILEAILFFKLWGACDNIKRIADKYAPEKQDKPHRPNTPETKEEMERWLKEDR